jgi:hypothetical protein
MTTGVSTHKHLNIGDYHHRPYYQVYESCARCGDLTEWMLKNTFFGGVVGDGKVPEEIDMEEAQYDEFNFVLGFIYQQHQPIEKEPEDEP